MRNPIPIDPHAGLTARPIGGKWAIYDGAEQLRHGLKDAYAAALAMQRIEWALSARRRATRRRAERRFKAALLAI